MEVVFGGVVVVDVVLYVFCCLVGWDVCGSYVFMGYWCVIYMFCGIV